MCPKCRQNAPIVYRGMAAYCTACGAPRLPLSSTSVTLAGTTQKIGGTLASALGWIVLFGGLFVALLLGVLLQVGLPAGAVAGYIVGGGLALLSILFGAMLLKSGRSLRALGTDEVKNERVKAIFALAQNRSGMLSAMNVAQALDMRVEDADKLLTELAKTAPDQVSLELDDAGGVYYRFPAIASWSAPPVSATASAPPRGVRVETRARVDAPPAERSGEVVEVEPGGEDEERRRRAPQ